MAIRNRKAETEVFHERAVRARMTQLLHAVAHYRRNAYDRELREYGITAAQWWVILRLARTNDAGLSQTELARQMENGKASAGALIARLEAMALVDRRIDPADARIRRIYLTDRGYAMIEHISAVGNRLDNRVFENVTEEQIQQATALLQQLRANLRKVMGEPDH